jgi:hypothetical protein
MPPGAAALSVPANDNGGGGPTFLRRAAAVLLAGSILFGGGIEYIAPYTRHCQPSYTPDTRLADLDENGRRYLIKAMIRQEGTGHKDGLTRNRDECNRGCIDSN